MNDNDGLKALRRRLGGVPKNVVRQYDKTGFIGCGQLWSAKGVDEKETPSWLLLITEELGDGLFNACPVFRWGELAGPEDVYLPGAIAGANLIVSLELESTVDGSMLDQVKFHGRLPREAVDFVLQAKAALEDLDGRDAFSWGMEYAQNNDVRLAYHERISACLEAAQAGVRARVFEELQTSVSEDDSPVISFVDFSRCVARRQDAQNQYALAAATQKPERPLWNFCLMCVDPKVRVRIAECVEEDKMAALIEEDPAGVLPGAVLIDESGNQLGVFEEAGVPPVAVPKRQALGIRLANGKCLKLSIEED
jgi:hypothetical protein